MKPIDWFWVSTISALLLTDALLDLRHEELTLSERVRLRVQTPLRRRVFQLVWGSGAYLLERHLLKKVSNNA